MSISLETAGECPICRAVLDPGASECPRCGEAFSPEALAEELPLEADRPTSGAREKFLYYAGIVLILLGGPGIALGSWLHDVLRVSYLNYDSFDIFGPVNRLVVAVGLIVMIVGVVFLILSLRLSRSPESGGS